MANDLDIIIPAGQKLIATEEEVEDKIITMTQTIKVQSLSKKNTKLYAMSSNMYKNVPLRYTIYKVGAMASGDLLKLAEVIDENNYQSINGQVAVWMVTDNAQSSYLQQLGASSSMISSAKDMLIDAGIKPPEEDDAETDDGFDFGSIFSWICPAIIIILVILAILGAIGKRSEAKAASHSPTSPTGRKSPSQKSPYPSDQKQFTLGKTPAKSSQIPQINHTPSTQSSQPPPPPPPPPPKTEKVEPMAYTGPKKDKKRK